MGLFGSDSSSSDTPDFTSDFSSTGSTPSGTTGLADNDLQEFLLMENEKATMNSMVLELNDRCWEMCFTDKPGSKLSGKAETCFSNCVDRFIDVAAFINNRFITSMRKKAM